MRKTALITIFCFSLLSLIGCGGQSQDEIGELVEIIRSWDNPLTNEAVEAMEFAQTDPKGFCVETFELPEDVCESYKLEVSFGTLEPGVWGLHDRLIHIGTEVLLILPTGAPLHPVDEITDEVVLSDNLKDYSKEFQALVLAKEISSLTLQDEMEFLTGLVWGFHYPEVEVEDIHIYGNLLVTMGEIQLTGDVAAFYAILPIWATQIENGNKDFLKAAEDRIIHSDPEFFISQMTTHGLMYWDGNQYQWTEGVLANHPVYIDLVGWEIFYVDLKMQDFMIDLGLYAK